MNLREGIEFCDSVSPSLGTDMPAESPHSVLFWHPLYRADFPSVGGLVITQCCLGLGGRLSNSEIQYRKLIVIAVHLSLAL